MEFSLTKKCPSCAETEHIITHSDSGVFVSECRQCGMKYEYGSEIKRYVLDGPPGSGKSTVLFGISDGESGDNFDNTMVGKGYHCIHESVAEANVRIAERGLDFEKAPEAWLQTIVEIDREKYFNSNAGITFFDRCFHHWQLLSHFTGIKLPGWYDKLNMEIRYNNPIFLVAPVKSMDLAAHDIPESRRFTWEQRLSVFEQAKTMYQRFGYDVVEVPMFVEGDIEKNNELRIKHILETLKLDE